jgi:hypothetical protein
VQRKSIKTIKAQQSRIYFRLKQRLNDNNRLLIIHSIFAQQCKRVGCEIFRTKKRLINAQPISIVMHFIHCALAARASDVRSKCIQAVLHNNKNAPTLVASAAERVTVCVYTVFNRDYISHSNIGWLVCSNIF